MSEELQLPPNYVQIPAELTNIRILQPENKPPRLIFDFDDWNGAISRFDLATFSELRNCAILSRRKLCVIFHVKHIIRHNESANVSVIMDTDIQSASNRYKMHTSEKIFLSLLKALIAGEDVDTQPLVNFCNRHEIFMASGRKHVIVSKYPRKHRSPHRSITGEDMHAHINSFSHVPRNRSRSPSRNTTRTRLEKRGEFRSTGGTNLSYPEA